MANDHLRRFRDELVRQIDKRTTPGSMSGVVSAQPDTWANTVAVRIGTQEVVAAYRGPVPNVGDPVEVQRTGSSYKITWTVPPVSRPDSSGSFAASTVTAPNMFYLHDMGGWGHSYLDTIASVDVGSGHQIANRLFSALGISWPHGRNYGQGGGVIYTKWRTVMRTARPSRDNWGDTTWQAKFGPQFFLWGANDVGRNGDPTFEGNRFLNNWASCWRAVFSWFRAGAIYYADWIYGGTTGNNNTQGVGDTLFAGGKCGVTYGANWSATTDPNYACVGPAGMQTTVSGSSFVVKLPPNFPGTPVTLYFGAEVGPTGSTNGTVTHGGSTPASPVPLVTNDRVRTPSTYAGETPIPSVYPVRIVGIPKGDRVTSQTITVNAGTLAGGHSLVFMGWSIEAAYPPLLIPCNVPPPGGWNTTGYKTDGLAGNSNGAVMHWAGWPQSNGVQTGPIPTGRTIPQDGDTWCRNSYNPTLATVAAEFAPAGTVSIADLAKVADGTVMPDLYSPNDLGGSDNLHPNGVGKATMVVEILAAINRVPLDPRYLIAPWDANDQAEAYRMFANT